MLDRLASLYVEERFVPAIRESIESLRVWVTGGYVELYLGYVSMGCLP